MRKNRSKIEKFIRKQKLFVIGVNSSSGISENLVDLRTICHPRRFISDSLFLRKTKTPIVIPLSITPEKLKKFLNLKNKITYNYGLKIRKNKKLIVKKNFCQLSAPLVIIYSLALILSRNINKIFIAGFDGFKKNDPNMDETGYLLNKISRKKSFFLRSITKTDLKIRHYKI